MNPIKAHSAYFNSVAGMRVLFWIAVFGRMPPEIVGLPNRRSLFFRILRPATKWISMGAVWTTPALLLCAIFFDNGIYLFYALCGQALTVGGLLAAGGIADFRHPLLFSRVPPNL